MKYQDNRYAEMTQDELLNLEKRIHNEEYTDGSILGSDSLEFSLDEFWKINNRPYYKGAYKTGFRKRRLFELLNEEGLESKRVIDVGCGKGVESVVCAKYGADVVGIDISEEAINTAEAVAEANGVVDKCHFSIQSIHDTEFSDGSFDIVLCNAVLHHILKYSGVVEELHRIISPDGMVAIGGGLRRNPIYNTMRDVKRIVIRETVKGDVDIDMNDINKLSHMFDYTYFEYYSLFSSIKRLFSEEYMYSVPVRALLFVTERLDDAIDGTGLLERYGNEIVGILSDKK